MFRVRLQGPVSFSDIKEVSVMFDVSSLQRQKIRLLLFRKVIDYRF
jgi:hypothetical protein